MRERGKEGERERTPRLRLTGEHTTNYDVARYTSSPRIRQTVLDTARTAGLPPCGQFSFWSPDVGIVVSAEVTTHHHRGVLDYSGMHGSDGHHGGDSFGEYLADQMPEWSFTKMRVAYLAPGRGPVEPPRALCDRAAMITVPSLQTLHAGGVGRLQRPNTIEASSRAHWMTELGAFGIGWYNEDSSSLAPLQLDDGGGAPALMVPDGGCIEVFNAVNDSICAADRVGDGATSGTDDSRRGTGNANHSAGGAGAGANAVRFGLVDPAQPTGPAIYSRVLVATGDVATLGRLLPFPARTLAGDAFAVHCNAMDAEFDIKKLVLAQHPAILDDGADFDIVGVQETMTRAELIFKLQQPGANGSFVVVHAAPSRPR